VAEPVLSAPAGGDPRPWAIVQHVGHEGPGLIGEVLAAAGYASEVIRMDLGADLPDVALIQQRIGLKIPIVEIFSNDSRLANLASWNPVRV